MLVLEHFKCRRIRVKRFEVYKNLSLKFKKPIIIILILVFAFVGASLGYKHYKGVQWSNTIIAPDALAIRDKFDSALIINGGFVTFEGQVQINDIKTINKIIDEVKEGKYIRSCSVEEANNFNTDNVSFSIGTVRYNKEVQINTLSTVNIFKDGTFIAGKNTNTNSTVYMKGKLRKNALSYIEEIYKNNSIIK
jgi:hypothetical protein